MLNFPPFCRLVRLVFRAPTEKQAVEAAEGASSILRNELYALYNQKISPDFTQEQKNKVASTEILGPAECPLSKISGSFRWQLILKGQDITILQKAASGLFYNYSRPTDVYIETDVDPVNLL